MPFRLAFASTVTIGLLAGGLLSVLFVAAVIAGLPAQQLWIMMGLHLAFTLSMWVFGPWVMDLILRYTYKCSFLEFDAFERRNPNVGAFVREVCEREDMPLPSFRIIHDDNPTAYTYGTLPQNARIGLSDGLFRFCTEREVQAVVAHELGHIRHYDFAVMTLATALLQLLYEAYFYLYRREGKKGGKAAENLRYVGLIAYALWWVGTYVVLWLSRTREYMADAFAAEQMGDAAPLQKALIKIAYGLAEVQARGTEEAKGGRLLQSTRALGIADPKASDAVGRAVATTGAVHGNAAVADDPFGATASVSTKPTFDPRAIEPVFAFDLFSPWAMVGELGSTHPLTGKRIRALEDINAELGNPQLFDFERLDEQDVDTQKLYSDFSFEVVIYFLPQILPFVGLLLGLFRPEIAAGLMVFGFGLGVILRGAYSYAMLGDFEPTTVFELMCDPYASPLRGRPVALTGEIMGKGNAGSRFSEDMMMKDRSGALIYLNYENVFGKLGNLFFGATTATRAIGRGVKVKGWFRRGISQHVEVHDLEVTGMGRIASYTRSWEIGYGVIAIPIGAILIAIGLMLPAGSMRSMYDGYQSLNDPSAQPYIDEDGNFVQPSADDDGGGEDEPYVIPSLDP